MKEKIILFDSTLRDGSQAESISYSVGDKIAILKALDKCGIDYIESGNPGSNPKDIEFFEQLKDVEMKHAKLCAFGSTRKSNIGVEDDRNIKAILKANTPAVAIFGKTSVFHITDIIRTTLDENLKMIEETIRYLVENGKEVTFDAEHFFDGYFLDKDYALEVLKVAEKGGASYLTLCDTNGGTLPFDL
ncbi:MAG: hypothetical protein GX127_01220 [Eubacteriaceae bacterium]|nr:hypothetical protein [Eubacteriaceae bacterium]